MTGMEDAIEHAARIMQAERDDPRHRYDEAGEPRGATEQLARALASAGLLAPAPLREEWGSVSPASGGVQRESSRDRAMDRTPHGGRIARRLVSDWSLADRTEGDGRTNP